MKIVAGQVLLCMWIVLSQNAAAIVPQQSPAASTNRKPATPVARVTADASSPGYDRLLSDIDEEKDAEQRLKRYFALAADKSATPAVRDAAMEKWLGLFEKRMAAIAAIEPGNLPTERHPENWDAEEKSFQDAVSAFPAHLIRAAYGGFLLRRAAHEIDDGHFSDGANLIGRAQELSADAAALSQAREHLHEREGSWPWRGWYGLIAFRVWLWTVITKILGSATVWALVGITFGARLYLKLRGNRKDYQFEPFIVVQQHDADAKDKIYPGLTARLLREMKRVEEIHQGTSQRALDEISDPLGNWVRINFTEYEPELTSKIEQIPEISVGAVKLPVVSYLAIMLRVNSKRVRTYYEEFNQGTTTYMRLIADMRGTRSLVVQAAYTEPKGEAAASTVPPPAAAGPAAPVAVAAKQESFLAKAWRHLLTFLDPAKAAVGPAPSLPATSPAYGPKEEVLNRLIVKLACELRYARVADEASPGSKKSEAYSRTGEVYREFTLGLDAQHEAARIMRGTDWDVAAAQSKLNEARQHYSEAIADQGDHAAAYFCRAGICLQDAQITKKMSTYVPDTPTTVAAFRLAPARTKIDEAIDDYRVAARTNDDRVAAHEGSSYLSGLCYFNLANIFYRIHRCDAYSQALEYADLAETACEKVQAAYSQPEAAELCRRVWLLKISVLLDRGRICAPDPRRGPAEVEIGKLQSKFAETDSNLTSEYWRISAKIDQMELRRWIEDGPAAETWVKIPRALEKATRKARRALEMEPRVAENHNTYAGVLFARLKYLLADGHASPGAMAAYRQEMLAAYDRGCLFSSHEYFFYNRAICYRYFFPDQRKQAVDDYKKACSTIATGKRSSVALDSFASYLDSIDKDRLGPLAKQFYSLADLDDA